ncbi:MAG: NAD(P)H-dependent oxidoreductase [Candidatus Eremiobacteraeota bacterium]|nr:NAD(P)H-dependent oxidoreductase [Candidatus Eremiobacteraeota bacterium]
MKITIIDGHPDPQQGHLNHALAERYALAAEAAGHEIRRINVASLTFPMMRDPKDFTDGHPVQDIVGAQEDISWADHLVFFFPLWMSDMPSLLKAFLEQTFRPGFASRGKSARIIVTMGMPAFFYYGPMGAHMLKMFSRALIFAGIRPVSSTVIGSVENASDGTRDRWFAKMDALVKRDGNRRRNRVAMAAKLLAAVTTFAGGAYLGSALLSWARYGATSRSAESDSLLDRFMSNYEVSLRHGTIVHAPASLTFAAIRLSDFERSPMVRALTTNEWGVLALDLGREIVLGTVTKPWQPNARFRLLDAQTFATFAEPGYAKIALALRVDEVSSEHCEARIETRVQTTDPISRARFRRYWALLSPGMIVIRRALLQQVKTEAEAVWERARPLAGMRFEDTEDRSGAVS